MTDEPTYTLAEVAALCGLYKYEVVLLIRRGQLQARWVEKRVWRVTQAALEAYRQRSIERPDDA